MGQVNRFVEKDIPDVANIHVKVNHKVDNPASEALKSYYKEIFFHNPWRDNDLPSLVYRSKKGKIVGFIGVIPRRMIFKGKLIRVAIAHRLMVDPNSNYPLAAIKLIKTFFSGPQDMSFSDGANDIGRKFWEGMGGSTAYLYSMNWIRPLRPCRYATSLLGKKRGFRLFSITSWPICCLVDSLSARIQSSPFRTAPSETYESIDIDDEILLSCISEFSKELSLYPEYDSKTIKWLMYFLQSNKHRGILKSFVVYNRKNQPIGVCLYYLNSKKIGEVMLLAARGDSRDGVLKCLLYHAWQEGAISIFGRLEPKFLQNFWDYNCLIKRGSWALVHARNPDILNIINQGYGFLSALEGELWLRSPKDRL